MDIFSNTWEFVSLIEQAADEESIQICLIDIAQRFGFSSVFGGILPPIGTRWSQEQIASHALIQHMPGDWAVRYNESDYFWRDPVVTRLFDDRTIFSWSESYSSCRDGADVRLIQGEAADFGLIEGLAVPVSTLDGHGGAISFGGDRTDLTDDDRSTLSFIANFAVGHWLSLRRPRSAEATPLTARELDCLLWAGEGKTDWEISMILGISRSTVIKHLLSARDKLDATNKTHAVALALRRKIMG